MTEQLPDSVALIAEVIGTAAALQLVRCLPRIKNREMPKGRISLYVPSTMTAEHPIAQIIGYDAALKLSKRFGHEVLFLATCNAHELRRAVIGAIDGGAPPAMVARVFGITPRHVRRIARADISAVGARATQGEHSRMNYTANSA